MELEGDHQALRHLYNATSKQLETEKDNINLQVIDILTYVYVGRTYYGMYLCYRASQLLAAFIIYEYYIVFETRKNGVMKKEQLK